MDTFELRCPKAGEAATYWEIDRIASGDLLRIGHLTGCMGLICVKFNGTVPQHALMMHDADSGYPHTQEKLNGFITTHNPFGMAVVWKAEENVNQTEWMIKKGVLREAIEVVRTGTLIHSTAALVGSRMPGHWNNTPAGIPGDPGRTGIVPRPPQQLGDLGPENQKWVKDEDAKSCMRCQKTFGFFTRRHHCRNCGKCICGDCSVFAEIYSGMPASKRRYCKDCVRPTSSKGNWLESS